MIQPDIFQQAVLGDGIALNHLFMTCRPQLYAIALRLCGNIPAAEDAVQDAQLLAYTRLYQLKDPAAFFPWIHRIVRNCCYQQLRTRQRLAAAEALLPAGDQLIDDSICRRYEELASRETLYAALSFLPEQLRTTMLLRYLSDYPSYEEIAAIMGVPVGTIRSRLNDGKKQLSRYWDQLQHADTAEYGKSHSRDRLYSELFPAIYDDFANVRSLLAEIDPSLKLIFTSGKTVSGRSIFEESIYDDMEHGSGVSEVRSCISSGNITVVNLAFFNSADHPDHCPPGSFVVLRREKELISSMRLYHSARDKVISEYA